MSIRLLVRQAGLTTSASLALGQMVLLDGTIFSREHTHILPPFTFTKAKSELDRSSSLQKNPDFLEATW